MNIKTTIILLVLLIGVGSVVLFTRDKSDGTTPAKPVEHNLLDVKDTDVSKIKITAADGKVIALVKGSDSNWSLTEPVKAGTDSYKVTSLVSSLTSLKSTAAVDKENVGNTGLDKPQFTVVLTAGAKDYTLKVGDKLAVGNGVYVRAGSGDGADVVNADLVDTLSKPASELRKSQLFEASSYTVQQIDLKKKDGSEIALEKQAKGWQMLKPTTMPAEQSAAEDLVGSVLTLQPVTFVDDPSTAIGLKKPAYTLQFSTMAPTTQPAGADMFGGQTVLIGGYDGVEKKNVFAKLPDGTIVTVAASVIEGLNKKPIDLRDKTVVDIEADKVTGITIATETKSAATTKSILAGTTTTVSLARRKVENLMGPAKPAATGPSTTQATTAPVPTSKWVLVSDKNGEADDIKIETLLASLHPLKAEKWTDAPPTTAKTSSTVVTVTLTMIGKPPVTFSLTDTGPESALIGLFDGSRFEAPRTIQTSLTGDFKKSSAAPIPVTPPPSPFGGRPGGFPGAQ